MTSFVGVEQLELSSWRDVTGDFSRLAHVSRFTRVKVLVKCIPEDEDAGGLQACYSYTHGIQPGSTADPQPQPPGHSAPIDCPLPLGTCQCRVPPLPRGRVTGRAWLAIRDRLVTLHGKRDAYYTVSSSVTVADKGEHTYMISGGNCFIEGLVSIPAYVASVLVCWDWLYLIWLQAMSHGVTIQLKKKYAAGGSAV